MRLLLDTQILYWSFYEPRNVPDAARKVIEDAEAVFVSAVSVWEIAIKVRIGKMNANLRRLVQLLGSAGFEELPVYFKHAVIVADLPLHHGDPFDRLLVAQAISEPMHMLTTDPKLPQYSPLVIQV
jgi:PIN domain nuclease of toxin-antitoxin system